MNRRQFALSWGRKLFFGLSWPLSIVLALLYARSFILPANGVDWIYYVASIIGQTGLLTVVFYFVLFCPLVMLFPFYYVSRICLFFSSLRWISSCSSMRFRSPHIIFTSTPIFSLYYGDQKVYVTFRMGNSLLSKGYFLELVQRRLIK